MINHLPDESELYGGIGRGVLYELGGKIGYSIRGCCVSLEKPPEAGPPKTLYDPTRLSINSMEAGADFDGIKT
jgi:hypothetical protein